MEITLEQFAAATGATEANAGIYYPAAVETMERFAISEDEQRSAAFLATLSIESQRLTHMEEDLYYRDPFRLAKIFPSKFKDSAAALPYCRNPRALSQKLYNGFHGRGGIMITWEANYRKHGDRLGVNFVDEPEQLLTPYWAMMSAGDYWDLHQCNDIAYDMDEVTLRVNGKGRMHLALRIAQRDVALGVFA